MRNAVQIATLILPLVCPSVVAGVTPEVDAIEAGARYAQALGAGKVCPSVSVSKTTEALRARFHGQQFDQFNARAAAVYSEWLKVKNCFGPNDPNPCRIMIELSCKAAIAEIGPSGSAYPNLLVLERH
jgi:hypothetical protein